MQSTEFQWQWCAFDELSTAALYAVLAARASVFVVEQACAYQDLDGYDPKAGHLIAWRDGQVAAYLRTFGPGIKYAEPSLGRVLSTQPFRGTGVGREVVARGLQVLERLYPGCSVRISAQAYLARFYGSFGFGTQSGPYLEDGIPHLDMLRRGATA